MHSSTRPLGAAVFHFRYFKIKQNNFDVEI